MDPKTWTLRFNASNKTSHASFEALKDGTKTIETRAATERYRKVQAGDTLIFICGTERLEKQVKKVEMFKSLDSMLKVVPFKKINPFAKTLVEVRRGYDSFTDYKEKLKEFGICAFYI